MMCLGTQHCGHPSPTLFLSLLFLEQVADPQTSNRSEAILILRKLSENMYGLEYLDLTGCSSWIAALAASADGDHVDWVGAWGKVTHLILRTGYAPLPKTEWDRAQKFNLIVETARGIEKLIRTRRAGRGRFITVEKDAEVKMDRND